ncbi:cytochrome P450 [Penicillium macrosclerotiorum]|uniref:cytochrome P450 n=1 Tax=Penicillium macrosclerotiorum TaxID=303699 RepID=UPI0025479AC3|nr:cytochrome P450 [Penicillium macrosclerotiorum]KAJ5676175.1 cytochrome P450 [Penicillium macrosclerotiorum]
MTHPEYIEPLREEIEAGLKLTENNWTVVWKHTPKLESFTRETLRLNQPSLGLTVKPGTLIALPTRDILRDPEFYQEPEKFDGYRFYDFSSETTDPLGSVTPSETWLPFGIGISACPARKLGLRTAQMLFAKTLLAYDIDFASDKDRKLDLEVLQALDLSPNPQINMRVRVRMGFSDKEE